MVRRIAILVLVSFVAVAAGAACPQGAAACPVARRAVRDCCAHHTVTRDATCCCARGALSATPTLTSAEQATHGVYAPSLAGLSAVPCAAPPLNPLAVVTRGRGLAPPDTLIAQHTALLL